MSCFFPALPQKSIPAHRYSH